MENSTTGIASPFQVLEVGRQEAYTEEMGGDVVGYSNSVSGKEKRLSMVDAVLDGIVMLLTAATGLGVIIGIVAILVFVLRH